MNPRQLFLLSAYRLPTTHQIMLNEEEMASWFNGYLLLWHPALLYGAVEPPRIDSSYEHESPKENQVFAIPHAPPLFQSEDWPDRVAMNMAIRFEAIPDRQGTVSHLQSAVEESIRSFDPTVPHPFRNEATAKLMQLTEDQYRPFLALGLGYILLESLFDAMDHQHLLAVEDFWNDIQQGIQGLLQDAPAEAIQEHLQNAANRLLTAREVLYPSMIMLLDLAILDEKNVDNPLPIALKYGTALNLLASGQTLERLAAEYPEKIDQLKTKLHPDISPPVLEVCGGCYLEREDALLPMSSQIWNLRRGKAITQTILGCEVEVYARQRSAFHPYVPQLLYNTGFRYALLLHWDNSVLPSHRATVINWAAPDGKSMDAFTREPLPAQQTSTFFNLVYHLHHAITQDTAPTIALGHRYEADSPLYLDLLTLQKLAPVFGSFTTFSRYFSDALAGEYAGSSSADDFFCDYLEERTTQQRPDPISGFSEFIRVRRQIDHVWGLAAIYRGLHTAAPTEEERQSLTRLQQVEDTLEKQGVQISIPETIPPYLQELDKLEAEWSQKMSERLQVRSAEKQPGYLLLNTCGYTRRVALELDPISGAVPLEGPIKALQLDTDKMRVVVEIPPMGFAWIPRAGKSGGMPKQRLRMAEGNLIRNEFLEAEVDPVTGGLRTIRDVKTRTNRLGQQLVFNPGSQMEVRSIQITQNGTALGEIVSEGVLLNTQNEELARFRQRFRCWLSRPVLELRIELEPLHLPTGYPWHAYYGSRFACRDDRTGILRSVNGSASVTNHTRPQTTDFIEFRSGRTSTCLFPGGLPFHQKHSGRMLDVLLLAEGEQARSFDLFLALDREHPMQTAQGIVSPISIVSTEKGPPSIGPSGWLYQIDTPNLLLTSLKPREITGGASRALVAHLQETSSFGGTANFRCVRDPIRAYFLDGNEGLLMDARSNGDAVTIDFTGNDFLQLQIDFD